MLSINLLYPANYAYFVGSITFHGYARLEPGVTATLLSTLYFSQGVDGAMSSKTTLSGGATWADGTAFNVSETFDRNHVINSPCGSPDGARGTLSANSRYSLTTTDPEAAGGIGSIAGGQNSPLLANFTLGWVSCG